MEYTRELKHFRGLNKGDSFLMGAAILIWPKGFGTCAHET